jgi:hypothetical protein
MNAYLVTYLEKSHVSFPLVEIWKILAQNNEVKKFLRFDEFNDTPIEDFPIVLLIMSQGRKNGNHNSFYVYLLFNEFMLHNCMLYSRESTNLIPLKVMKKLGPTCT